MRLVPVAAVALTLGLALQADRSTAARRICALAAGCEPDLYSVSATGHRRLVLDNRSSRGWDILDVSPDRRRVVFYAAPVLFTASVSGGDVHEIATVSVLRQAAWSPDGTQIAFSGPSTSDDCPTGVGLWLVPAGGGGLTKLSDCAAFPAWSADSRRVAFLGNYDGHRLSGTISVAGVDGEGRRDLAEWNSTIAPTLSWSPGGDRIAYTYELRRSMIGVVSAAGAGRLLLPRARGPAWSPDGRRLAFEQDGGAGESLQVLDVAAGTRRQVDRARGLAAAVWSRAGALAWFRYPFAGRPGLFVARPGASPRRLTSEPPGALVAGLYWSPDSRSLLYGRCVA